MLNIIFDNIEQCGSTSLFKAVFINPEQVVRFLLCKLADLEDHAVCMVSLLFIDNI